MPRDWPIKRFRPRGARETAKRSVILGMARRADGQSLVRTLFFQSRGQTLRALLELFLFCLSGIEVTRMMAALEDGGQRLAWRGSSRQ